MVKPEITTEATGGCEYTVVRLARMTTAITERRTGATWTGPIAFFECDESTFGRTAVSAAFPHSRLIGRKGSPLELRRWDSSGSRSAYVESLHGCLRRTVISVLSPRPESLQLP
jgi:hypothetical protein